MFRVSSVPAPAHPLLSVPAATLAVRALVRLSPPAKRFHLRFLLRQPQVEHSRLPVLVDAAGKALSCPRACLAPSETLPCPCLLETFSRNRRTSATRLCRQSCLFRAIFSVRDNPSKRRS